MPTDQGDLRGGEHESLSIGEKKGFEHRVWLQPSSFSGRIRSKDATSAEGSILLWGLIRGSLNAYNQRNWRAEGEGGGPTR